MYKKGTYCKLIILINFNSDMFILSLFFKNYLACLGYSVLYLQLECVNIIIINGIHTKLFQPIFR